MTNENSRDIQVYLMRPKVAMDGQWTEVTLEQYEAALSQGDIECRVLYAAVGSEKEHLDLLGRAFLLIRKFGPRASMVEPGGPEHKVLLKWEVDYRGMGREEGSRDGVASSEELKLHSAIQTAVALLNQSIAAATDAEAREAHFLLRKALMDYREK